MMMPIPSHAHPAPDSCLSQAKRLSLKPALAAALFLGGGAAGANAQLIPTLVNDPISTGAIVYNGFQIEDHRDTVLAQIYAFVQTLEAHGNLPFRDIQAAIDDLEDYMYTAGGLGYQLANLEAQFQAIYDGGQVYVSDFITALNRDLEQIDAAFATAEGTLLTMQGHRDQLLSSAGELVNYKNLLEDAGISPTEVEQVAASVRAFAAQEVQLLRQTLMSQVNLEAVYIGSELNEQAETIRRTIDDAEAAYIRARAVTVPAAPTLDFSN